MSNDKYLIRRFNKIMATLYDLLVKYRDNLLLFGGIVSSFLSGLIEELSPVTRVSGITKCNLTADSGAITSGDLTDLNELGVAIDVDSSGYVHVALKNTPVDYSDYINKIVVHGQVSGNTTLNAVCTVNNYGDQNVYAFTITPQNESIQIGQSNIGYDEITAIKFKPSSGTWHVTSIEVYYQADSQGMYHIEQTGVEGEREEEMTFEEWA